MESIFFEVLKKLLNDSLAPVLFGALAAIVYLNFQFKLPQKLDDFRRRIVRIERRQKVLASMLEALLSKSGAKVDVDRLEQIFNTDADDEDIIE